ncbi:MAG: ATP-binding cassette domain-containing protein [Clostridium sp.]|nr:ATP-binding cassette domain-containing protein [Clostridium sp.]
MLQIENLSVKLKKKQIIEGLSCQFESGIHGLLGPNGAGKTTLMRSVLGLYPQTKGNITVDDIAISNIHVGYLPQKFGLFPNMTVRQVLTYMGTLKKLPAAGLDTEIKTLVSEMNLEDKIDCKMSALSGGMVRRVGIAQAFIGNPNVIILDEPTAGLDPEERLRFKNYIKANKGNHIIIISTHIVDDIDYLSDYVEIMESGRILVQEKREEIANHALDKVFGVTGEELDTINAEYYLVKEYEDNGNKKMRIISKERIQGESLSPTLEDGYLCILKEK